LTIAPADTDIEKTVYTGKIAHIRAAAKGGPRFDLTMSPEERKAIGNAIFLCSNCAAMIDSNQGNDFAADLLRNWKQTHETWVRDEYERKSAAIPFTTVSGMHEAHGEGLVIGLDIQGPAIITPGTIVRATGRGVVTGTRIGLPRKE
jgi:hypothetical protein